MDNLSECQHVANMPFVMAVLMSKVIDVIMTEAAASVNRSMSYVLLLVPDVIDIH